MRSLLPFFLLSVLLFFYMPSFAQRDTVSLNDVVEKSNKVAQSYPIEKVYLHFDKPYYAVEDTIWYKVYLTYTFNEPSALSKIVYVDIISSDDVLMQSFMLQVKNGTAQGSIPLPKDIYNEDNYHIRAYTKWMWNFDQSYFFNKTVTVGDAIKKPVSSTITLNQDFKSSEHPVNASIIYRDAQGKPYADKKVNWYVAVGYEDIAKGKGSTDKDGLINISFDNKKGADLAKANLHISLETESKDNYIHDVSLKSIALPADVQFFPEGGNLINGIPTKIAMKAVQSSGLGTGFNANIIDSDGKTVATCKDEHAGMGAFLLTTYAGKTYKADVTFTNGSKQTYNLPRSQYTGFTLSANTADTSMIRIRLSADSVYFSRNKGKSYYIIAKSGQVVCFAARATLNELVFSAALPTNRFPTGLVQITLMNAACEPLSERLVFVSHNNNLNLDITSDKTVYPNRQKIKLNLLSKTSSAPVSGDLSLTVMDETRVPFDENDETTILSSILLTSDLKGYIEAPNYYFRPENKNKSEHLDLLLLTQGYRRFTYKDIIRDRLPQINIAPEQGIQISGNLNSLSGTPVSGGSIALQIPDKFFSTTTTTDKEGRYVFKNLAFADSANVIVSAKGNYNSRNLMVRVDPITYPKVSANPDYPDEKLNIDTVMSKYLVNSKNIYTNSRMLQEVVITGKAINKSSGSFSDYSSLSGLSSIDQRIISGDRLKGCNNLIMCLQTLAVGVTYDNTDNLFYVTRGYNAGNRTPMAIFVNGLPVDINYLAGVNAAEIESIEVFLKDQMGLVNSANRTNGVIALNMKKAPEGTKITLQELQAMLPQPSEAKLTPMGYHIAKTFYAPKYDVKSNSFGPDLRTTLYWNPKIITDTTGKSTVEFYSGDNKGTYKAIVEGIDQNGHIGRAIYRFKVQ